MPQPSTNKKDAHPATITSFLNGHYAEVRFADGTEFREGDMVERAK